MRRLAQRQQGLTLLEVVVSIGIFTFIMGTTLALVTTTWNVERQGRLRYQRHKQINEFFALLKNDLDAIPVEGQLKEAAIQPGTISQQGRFLGFSFGEGEAHQTLQITTFAVTDRVRITQADYRLHEEMNTVLLGRLTPDSLVLERQVTRGNEVIASRSFPQLSGLDLRYHDGNAWSQRWSSLSPPELLEVTLTVGVAGDQLPVETHRRILSVGGDQ